MKFQMPEKLNELTPEDLSKLLAAAEAEAAEINAISDDDITAEQTADLIALVGHIDAIAARNDEVVAEAAAVAEARNEARARLAARKDAPADDADGGDDEGEEDADGDGDDDNQDEDAPVEKEKVAVLASGKKSFAAKVADKTKHVEVELPQEKSAGLSITAAANIKGFDSGSAIEGLDKLAIAYANRAQSFANGGVGAHRGRRSLENVSYGGNQLSASAQRFSVATLHKPENEFALGTKSSTQESYDTIMAAARESRLPGGSLVAAGGWCAPSERIWGFLELESADGLLSIAEVNAARGGIMFSKGPQLGSLMTDTDLGWVMTEAQDEAGNFVKPIFDIECPDWDEVRIDAVGYALRAGLLTNSAYPELLRRYLSLAITVHARRMNALTISRIAALIGTATTFTPVGAQPSATADLLSAIELNAIRVRETHSMPINSTVEGVFPIWALAVVRADLSRRTGVDMLNVTDQQITAWFAARKVNAQFVRDYQPIGAGAANTAGGTAGWTQLPNAVEFMLYPAGSYVRLATDVIDLDTVYDVDNLTKNQFLAAFVEEGFGIANTGGTGVKVRVGLPNVFGSTGFPGIGAGAGTTFAPATAG